MALPTDDRARVQNSTSCASTPEVPQTQLAYATERLVLSTSILMEQHQALNNFFSIVFGRDNYAEDIGKEESIREAGEMSALMGAIADLHSMLDQVRSDIIFLQEQNL